MSGDYSRVRYDPRTDIAGVLMQQGRVQLDSDWNEWVAVLERRLRAETVDIFGVHAAPGVSGVAVVSPQTPDAFKIDATGGAITIGRGRMYVDGLLAENHGGGAGELDPLLAELRGQSALDYAQQPYFPAPPPLPAGGPHLAYLEVWQRELTYLQRPELVESAIAVDTTTRLQTVWQVRLLADVGSANCTTPDGGVSGWPALIQPSAGRMSIKAEGVPPDLDPCELPPSGGYRGLENQLYRIEIHEAGAVGTASFKWSRDNGSVASNVVEIVSNTATATELKLASLGRDAVLRFNTGDWVEVLDDLRELTGETGDPRKRRGAMRKITVDDAKQTIAFSPPLPADLVPGGGSDTLATRHTRVRRWDQKGTVRDSNDNVVVDLDAAGSTGLIPVPAAGVWVVLEHGVQIQFGIDAAGGTFHSGDYWVSAARAADTSVETFTLAPPRGIHRHYARLAIVNFPDNETDCRTPWPPACGGCCTISVAPGENIQAAIDALPDEGGCVCLKTGVHEIEAPLQLLASRVILRGESPGAIVRANGLDRVLLIGSANVPVSDVVIEAIRFEATPAEVDLGALLSLQNCARVRVRHCTLVMLSEQPVPPPLVGVYLDGVTDIDIRANRMSALLYGVMSRDYYGALQIVDNAIDGPVGRFLGQLDASVGQYGLFIDSNHTQGCRIENNRIRHYWIGIYLRHAAEGSLVADNRIARSAGAMQGDAPTDVAQMRQYLDARLYGIDVEAARCEIRGNYIDLRSAAWGGIRASGAHATIADNVLEAADKFAALLVPAGIYCVADAKNGNAADHAVVHDNRLLGPQTGIVISRVAAATASGNHVDGGGAGWYGVRIDDCSEVRCADNVLREVFFAVFSSEGDRNRVTGNRIVQTAVGITATQEADLEIAGNSVQSALLAGTALFVRGASALLGNRIANCGYAPSLSLGIAVYAEEVFTLSGGHLRIEDCEVIDTGLSADGTQVTTANAVGIAGWVPACQIVGNRVGYSQAARLDPQKEHRALVLIGPLAMHFATGAGQIEYMFGSAQVTDNHFRGPGRSRLIEFLRIVLNDNLDLRFEKLTFSDNVCDHLGAEVNAQDASVRLWGGHMIVMGNHVKAPANVNAMSLSFRNKVALMGNVTTGDYIDVGTVIPTPIANFNVRV